MRLTVLLLVTLCSFSNRAFAQTKYWIEFRDKGIAPKNFIPGNPIFEATRKSLSEACLLRRAKALRENPLATISIADAPLCPRYLDSLCALGISPIVTVRWEDAVSARLTQQQAIRLRMLRFVRDISPVGYARLLSSQPVAGFYPAKTSAPLSAPAPLQDSGCGYDPIIYEYGNSATDLGRINVWPLHAMGFDGSGVRLGFLDVGFRWRENDAFQRLHVLSEYDYIQHDSVTENQPGDSAYQDQHGTGTLSTAMGYLPDTLVGPAYGAGVYLAKTEYVPTEHHIEEDNYAAALEDMEAAGVDITSSSLGYFTFDPPDTSYTYADMNGHTAISTRAVERAAKLGVLVVTAMGNSGTTSYPYMGAPADADSILACGALDVNDSIAAFSSRGPTYDGRIKPDICAPGVNVWAQMPDGSFVFTGGTSFATPLVSGACCLIKQAHPEATAQQIRQAVMSTGNNAAHPDTAYGWGRLNAYAAALQLGPIARLMHLSVDSVIHICVGAAAKFGVTAVSLEYHFITGAASLSVPLSLVADSLIYSGTITSTLLQGPLYYRIAVRDGSGATTEFPASGWDEFDIPSHRLAVSLNPNPSHGVVMVTANERGNWLLFDPTGKEMRSGSSASITFSILGLTSGVYYFRFTARSGETKVLPLAVDQ